MRSRLYVAGLLFLSSVAAVAHAQSSGGDPLAGGLVSGDYLRITGGVSSPIKPQGSLRDWNSGSAIGLVWENWQPGSGGVGLIGYGFGVDYARMPLNETNFLIDFQSPQGGHATAASGPSAQLFVVSTSLRVRIPSPLVAPSIALGLGFINFRPSSVSYLAPTGNGAAKQQSRSGAALSVSGALDRQIVGRFGVYGEAQYSYGFTSLARLATPGGNCSANGCDVLKNTTIGTVRGGLRVRLGRGPA